MFHPCVWSLGLVVFFVVAFSLYLDHMFPFKCVEWWFWKPILILIQTSHEFLQNSTKNTKKCNWVKCYKMCSIWFWWGLACRQNGTCSKRFQKVTVHPHNSRREQEDGFSNLEPKQKWWMRTHKKLNWTNLHNQTLLLPHFNWSA